MVSATLSEGFLEFLSYFGLGCILQKRTFEDNWSRFFLQARCTSCSQTSNNKVLTGAQSTMIQHTHTHTRLAAFCPGLPGWASTRKVKPVWILLKQETMSGSAVSWAICKSAPRFRQITTPAPHHSVFLQAGCPFCRSTNSIKAQKSKWVWNWQNYWLVLFFLIQ